jgi:outer membrane protein TolC
MQERISQAEGGRTVAFADFLPESRFLVRPIAGDTNVGGYALPTIPTYAGNVAFGGIGERFNIAELNVQWILWDFGRTPGRYGQAVTQVEISRLQYERARQTVAFNVTAAYFQVLQARALRIVAQEAVVRAESVVRDAENFLKRGVGIRNDLLRAQTLLAEMQLNVIKARTAEGVAVAALNQAIGINVGCPTEIVDRPKEPSFNLSLSESLQLASDHREEFGVVVRAVRSARLGANVAGAEFMPRVLVGGVAAHQDSNLVKNANLVAGGLTIEMALFEGGRRLGKLQTAEADVRAAIAQGKEVCDKIAYEVHTAFLLIDDAKQRLLLARTVVAKARENLRVVRSLFGHGDATPTEVVDGELAMTRAQQDQFTAGYDYQVALARLAYAAGLPILTDFTGLGGSKP